MLIFLYGPDIYRSRQKLEEIIDGYKKSNKTGLSSKLLDLSFADFQDFKNEIGAVSMFKEKKLLVFKNAFSNQEFKDAFLKEAKKFIGSEDIVLFYEENKVPLTDSLFKFLKKESESQEFPLLTGLKLKAWAQKEFARYGARVNSFALEKLIFDCGSDLWRFSNEIQKLALYKLSAGNGEIMPDDVDRLVRTEIEADIFKTIDAAASKNKKQAICLVHKHLDLGEAPLKILSMFNYQFKNLLVIRQLLEKRVQYHLIPKVTGFHPFVVKKSCELCKKFSCSELKKICQMIFQADLQIKTGRIDPETALDLLVAEI